MSLLILGSIPQLSQIFLFGALAFLMLAFAKQKGFFLITSKRNADVPLKIVFFAFLIYLGINLLISPMFAHVSFLKSLKAQGALYTGVINIISNVLITLCLVFLILTLKKGKFRAIWNEAGESPFYSIKIGIFSWLIIFPGIIFLSNVLDYLIMLLFKLKEMPEQLAVEYVKTALKNPAFFALAAITVSIFAPFIEELLFRGFLQTYLINRLGRKIAIILTSVLFAFFHFAPEQKLSNITILGSLFVLSCFLGFLYEKQKSLLAPIVLHATFNFISMFNLLLFKGS